MANTTVSSAAAWRPDLQSFAAEDVIGDALVMQTSTVSGVVEGDEVALRVGYVDDATATFTAEGADISESTPDLAEVTVYTGKVTQLVKVSREQLGQPGASPRMTTSIKRAVIARADEAYISQDAPDSPATTPPAGLLNAGITSGGEISGDLDVLVDAITGVEEAGGQVSHIVASPSAWSRLSKLKTATDANVPLLGSGTEAGERRVLGVPVLTSAAVPTGQLIALDRMAVVSAAGPVLLATSSDYYFSSDSMAIRATFRFGAALVRPDRVVSLSVADPGAA